MTAQPPITLYALLDTLVDLTAGAVVSRDLRLGIAVRGSATIADGGTVAVVYDMLMQALHVPQCRAILLRAQVASTDQTVGAAARIHFRVLALCSTTTQPLSPSTWTSTTPNLAAPRQRGRWLRWTHQCAAAIATQADHPAALPKTVAVATGDRALDLVLRSQLRAMGIMTTIKAPGQQSDCDVTLIGQSQVSSSAANTQPTTLVVQVRDGTGHPWLNTTSSNPTLPAPATSTQLRNLLITVAARRLRVLLVEDSVVALLTSTLMLERLGHQVTGVATSDAGLAALAEQQFDLVFTDINLPGGSSQEIITFVSRRLPEHRPRLIAFTGLDQPQDHDDLLARGVDQVLVKPADKATLRHCIEHPDRAIVRKGIDA